MVSTNFEDEDYDSMDEESFVFHEHDDANPLDALDKLKNLINRLDEDAERVQQEISNAIKEYGSDDDSDDDSESAKLDTYNTTKDFLVAMDDKENRTKSHVLIHQGGIPPVGRSRHAACLTKKTHSHQRTPLASTEAFPPKRHKFFFNEESGQPRETLTTTNHQHFPITPVGHEAETQLFETPNQHQLSPDINIDPPPKPLDPYDWAYTVWREHGLMGRKGEPTPRQKLEIIVESSPATSLFQLADSSDWDLSPLNAFVLNKPTNSVTKGADRAKEFARLSTGNFQDVLSSWRKGHLEDTPNKTQALDFARLRKPANFQDLLRKWRHARQELAVSGQRRAITYAQEAKANLQSILKIWQDSQTAEFEYWAREHAKSPEEFQDLLRKWRQAPMEHRSGSNLRNDPESNTSVDEIMKQWRYSHTTEFEEWAREQAHSSEEFQELIRHWSEAKPLSLTSKREVENAKILRGDVKGIMKNWQESENSDCQEVVQHSKVHSPREFQELLQKWHNRTPKSAEREIEAPDISCERFNQLLSMWHARESPTFHHWARKNTSSQSEFQSLLRKWREGDPYHKHREEQAAKPVSGSVEEVVALWHQSETYDFKEWAQKNFAASEGFRDIMKQWADRNERVNRLGSEQHDVRDSNKDFDKLMSKWRTAEAPKFNKWARQNTTSQMEFQALLRKWREFNPVDKSDEQGSFVSQGSTRDFDQIIARWHESETYHFEEWARQNLPSAEDFQQLVHARQDGSVFQEQIRESSSAKFDKMISTWRAFEIFNSVLEIPAHSSAPPKVDMVMKSWRMFEILNPHLDSLDLAIPEHSSGRLVRVMETRQAQHHESADRKFDRMISTRRALEILKPELNSLDLAIPEYSPSRLERMTRTWQAQFHKSLDRKFDRKISTRSEFEILKAELRALDLAVPEHMFLKLARVRTWQAQSSGGGFHELMLTRRAFETSNHELNYLDLAVAGHFSGTYAKMTNKALTEESRDALRSEPKSQTLSGAAHPSETYSIPINGALFGCNVEKVTVPHDEQISRSCGVSDNEGSIVSNCTIQINVKGFGVDDGSKMIPNNTAIEVVAAASEKADFGNLMKKWKESKPSVCTGQHRAELFARDSSGNFDDIISTWREPKNINNFDTPDGSKRATEYARHSTGKFQDLISTWKGRPTHLDGIEEGNNQVENRRSEHSHALAVSAKEEREAHQLFIDTTISKCRREDGLHGSVDEDSEIPVKDRNSDEASFMDPEEIFSGATGSQNTTVVNKGYETTASTPALLKGSLEFTRHSTGKLGINTSKWREMPNCIDASHNQDQDSAIPRVNERSVAWDKDVVTDVKLFSDDISSDEESASNPAHELQELVADTYFEGLIKKWKKSVDEVQIAEKPVVDSVIAITEKPQHQPGNWGDHELAGESDSEDQKELNLSAGKQRAVKFALDSSGNFDALRTNWCRHEATSTIKVETQVTSNHSTGKQRASTLALDSRGNFDDLMSNWCKYEIKSGNDVTQDKMNQSAGKERAQEFAKVASVEISDLMARWSNKNYTSLEFRTPDTCREARSVPTLTPIKDFIAALSFGHAPLLGSVSSKDDKDETDSLFDEIEVASDVIPEGEDQFIAPNGHLRSCACASSIFSGNDKLVEFFLPQLGMACTCGKDLQVFPDEDIKDPTSIEMILRPWQCEFLKSFGIHRGDQLVKAHHRSAGMLAKAMKKWRKKHNLVRARTVSCGLALHIWSKVCKIYVRSIRRQIALGVEVVKPPSTMTVLSQILTQGDRRVSVPHTGRKQGPEETNDIANSGVEI